MARLADLRTQRKLTRAQLATRAGLPVAAVTQVEAALEAGRPVELLLLQRFALARTLGVTCSDIDEFAARPG